MSFVRSGARAVLRRWGGLAGAVAVVLAGAYLALAGYGIYRYVGGAAVLAGALAAWAAWQRMRFRSGGGGAGVVRVREGLVAYYGPLTGGAVALSEITLLELDPTGHPAHWALWQPGQPVLRIPTDAEGADALFDVFASLPGIDTERMLAELRRAPDTPVTIWRKPLRRLE